MDTGLSLSISLSRATRSFLVATAGCASKFWRELTPGEVRGLAVSISVRFPRVDVPSSASEIYEWLRDFVG